MLNNKGYGIKDIMMVICVMFVAILVTMFVYNRNFKKLFEGDGNLSTSYDYEAIEEELEISAKEYYSKTFSNEKTKIPLMTVTFKTLKQEGYLSSLGESDKNCTGYVNIKNDEKLSYEPYIKCNGYETKGYSETLNS